MKDIRKEKQMTYSIMREIENKKTKNKEKELSKNKFYRKILKKKPIFKYIPVKEQWYICGDISELLKDVDEPGL